MRTSPLQYSILVEFMERNGDLSKPYNGPRGRHYTQEQWKTLCDKLNSEGTGDSRSEEKWRKVWSDLKNNTKKKWAKIHRAASGTGGGPALQMCLSDLENRVMQLIGVHAATGMVFAETGLQTQLEERPAGTVMHTVEAVVEETMREEVTEEWNLPGTSTQPTVFPPSTTATIATDTEEHWTPPVSKKRRKADDVAHLFVESDRNARDYARQRDLVYERLETERLRLHEYEVRERVRQKDEEHRLQGQWLEFMKEGLNVLKKYFEREREKDE